MKTVRTMEEARRLKIEETARFKIPTRSVIVDDFACPACGVSFSMEETPRFCPRCGARWNGRAPAKAAVESE